MFIFLSVSMQIYLQHSRERECNSFSGLINCSLPCSLMANSWLHLQLDKSLCLDKLGGVKYKVPKKMHLGLKEGKEIYFTKISELIILNFVTSYLYSYLHGIH